MWNRALENWTFGQPLKMPRTLYRRIWFLCETELSQQSRAPCADIIFQTSSAHASLAIFVWNQALAPVSCAFLPPSCSKSAPDLFSGWYKSRAHFAHLIYNLLPIMWIVFLFLSHIELALQSRAPCAGLSKCHDVDNSFIFYMKSSSPSMAVSYTLADLISKETRHALRLVLQSCALFVDDSCWSSRNGDPTSVTAEAAYKKKQAFTHKSLF